MKITNHAARRFLERVIGQTIYTWGDVVKTKLYLKRVFANIVVASHYKHFPLPGFEKMFYVVYRDNAVITIIPKNNQ
jgi:hypothetical protein